MNEVDVRVIDAEKLIAGLEKIVARIEAEQKRRDAYDWTKSTLATSMTTAELATALAKAQGSFPHIAKDKVARVQMKAGGTYEYAYADLADILAAIRRPLAENGLSVVQPLIVEADRPPVLITRLMHASGEFIESTFRFNLGERPQDTGSAITYARRYALTSMLGIAADADDDAQAAQDGAKKPRRKTAPEDGPPPKEAKPDDQRARERLWALCKERWEDSAELKLRAAIAPATSTTDMTLAELTAAIEKVQDASFDPVVPGLAVRLRTAAEAEWAPSEADSKASGDPVEERRTSLLSASELVEEYDLADDDVARITGFKASLDSLAISSLRKAVDKLSEWEQARE